VATESDDREVPGSAKEAGHTDKWKKQSTSGFAQLRIRNKSIGVHPAACSSDMQKYKATETAGMVMMIVLQPIIQLEFPVRC
jgi:hypothetical protein